jgi:hypothetical protein
MGGSSSKEEDNDSSTCMTCKVDGVEKEAGAFCMNCAESLCSDCVRDHRKNKASRNHIIQEGTNNDLVVLKSLKSMVSCSEHQEKEVSIECKDHMKFMCRKCHFANHINCDVREIGSEISDGSVNNVTDELKEVHAATVCARECKEEKIKTLLDKQNALKQERDLIINTFDSLNKDLENEIENLVLKEKDVLESDIDECKAHEKELNLNKEFIQKVLQTGNSVWTEVVNDAVRKKTKQLKENINVLSNKKASNLNFKPSETFLALKQMSSLGKIEMIRESGLQTPVVHDVEVNLNFSSDAVEDTKDITSVSKTDICEVPGHTYRKRQGKTNSRYTCNA